jgi:SAM-dependent methyltransferase
MSRWTDAAGGLGADRGRAYAARFDQMAATGKDVHGEASLAAALVQAPARVLDAGCGTGRVAIRLAELGYGVVGVDVDASMLEVARSQAPGLTWLHGDLAGLAQVIPEAGAFDLVVAAGNVIPLVAPGTEAQVVAGLAVQLRADGLLLAGFGIHPDFLPISQAPVSLDSYDAMCADAGLTLVQRWSTWDRRPYDGGGYAVSMHRRLPASLVDG